MDGINFEYFFDYKHHNETKILRIVAEKSSIAEQILKQQYPHGHLKLIEIRRLDY
jgi:hypothetical protein